MRKIALLATLSILVNCTTIYLDRTKALAKADRYLLDKAAIVLRSVPDRESGQRQKLVRQNQTIFRSNYHKIAQKLNIINKQDAKKIKAVIYKNFQAGRDKNLEVAMSTIDPASPVYEQTEKFTQEIFENYDLSFKIDRYQLISISADRARVRVTATTKKINGSLPFRNNTLTSIYTMTKQDEEWKIYSTDIEKVVYL